MKKIERIEILNRLSELECEWVAYDTLVVTKLDEDGDSILVFCNRILLDDDRVVNLYLDEEGHWFFDNDELAYILTNLNS